MESMKNLIMSIIDDAIAPDQMTNAEALKFLESIAIFAINRVSVIKERMKEDDD